MQLTLRRSYIRTTFFGRLIEWAFAFMLLGWGIVVLMPGDLFVGPQYTAFRLLPLDEVTIGWTILIGGILRLLILGANGFWSPMYYFRAWMALSSFVVWGVVLLGFLSAGVVSTGLAVYPVLVVFEAINVFRALSDKIAADLEARITPPSRAL